MTHHSFGTSAQWFHHDPWIDLHTFGSYHFDFYLPRAYEQVEKDWSLPNPKPTLNSEPAYENHPVNWLDGNGVFIAYDVRQTAYWSVFAGAVGHTYGAHPIWQFYDTSKTPESPTFATWKEALDFPGSIQMKFLKQLIQSRPMLERIPDQSLILAGQKSGLFHIQATRGKNYAFIYLPTRRPVTIKLGIIDGKTIKAWWFNPSTGEATLIDQFKNFGKKSLNRRTFYLHIIGSKLGAVATGCWFWMMLRQNSMNLVNKVWRDVFDLYPASPFLMSENRLS